MTIKYADVRRNMIGSQRIAKRNMERMQEIQADSIILNKATAKTARWDTYHTYVHNLNRIFQVYDLTTAQ